MADLLTSYAQVQPGKLAVVDDRGAGQVRLWSYRDLEAEANRWARALIELGASPGDKVIWCGPNSAEVVAIVSAARKAGVVAVPLNYRLTGEEARYVIADSDAKIACVDASCAGTFAGLPGTLPELRHVVVYAGTPPEGMLGPDLVAAQPASPPPSPADADPAAATATMIYTSGTTGKPKGAVRRTRADDGAIVGLLQLIGYTPDDVYLTSGPLYHSGPGAFMSIALALGQTVVVQYKFDPRDWLRLVETYKVTSTFSAPALIRQVCSLPPQVRARCDRTSMRRMIANAAPWSFALKQLYLADFPPDSLWEVYGSTELGIDCVLEPADQLRKPGSCGKPAPGIEILLVDENGAEVTGTGPDHPGELYVRASVVFDEYYKKPDSYDKASLGDFHTVGDIAYRDEEGYLYICDRKTDMIISGGMNIYPAEIEAALEQHPGIYEAAVFGIPSQEWGEAVHAAVVRRPGADLAEQEVTSFARDHLASYKIPRSVSFIDELPRTGSGKVLKRVLRAPFWAGHSRQIG